MSLALGLACLGLGGLEEREYLLDARTAEGEVNFSDLGLQLTRSARALKLWVSLR